ncbi:MAG: TlpA disulfide reductase family protein [Nitrospinota bacterium]
MSHFQDKIIILTITGALTLFFACPSYSIDKALLKAAGIQELKQDAPDFTIKDDDGKAISLKDFRGKLVILHFWATWCKPCKKEFPLFEKLYQGFKEKDVVFPFISIDTNANKDEVDVFARGLGVTFPVFLAKDGKVPNKYWTLGVPVTYFIDRKGLIIGMALGERDWASENIKNIINMMIEEK